MAIIQSQTQKQVQKLTSQQIQLHNILALPTVALEQYIANEMAINPALEFDSLTEESSDENEEQEFEQEEVVDELRVGENFDNTEFMDRDALDNYKYEANNYCGEDDRREQVYHENFEFTTLLIQQFNLLDVNERERDLGIYLINTLESDGYLRRSLSDISDEISFLNNNLVTEEELEAVLRKVQTLEPMGIAARNLRECLLLQLESRKIKTNEVHYAIEILTKFMDDFTAKRFDKIRVAMDLDEEDFRDTLELIRKLNPAPAGSARENAKANITIEPDFTVMVNEGKVELFLNSAGHAPLKISDDYVAMLEQFAGSKDKSSREATSFIKSKVESARWFIEALQLREKTMVSVARAIVKHQQKFFMTGDPADLRPLILKTIAEEINSDISTVSRIASSKHMQTEYGIILIKDLFVEGLSTVSGETVSTNEVKLRLSECILNEDKSNPLSDDEIAKLLLAKNYSIARRTVAKYREELNIPSKNFRKVA